jgi:two-component system, chemotaxis family, CheB/CheR fusion protein
LLFPLRSAIQMARRKQRAVRKENVLVRRNGHWHSLNLEVVPLVSSAARHLLVVFEEGKEAAQGKARGKTREAKSRATLGRRETNERLAGLTRELAASREYLQSIIQEL